MKQQKKPGNIRYSIQNGNIIKCTLEAQSKRGHSWYCKVENNEDLLLITNDRLYKTEKLANMVKTRIKQSSEISKEIHEETKEIDNIVWKIHQEFDVKMPYLDWVFMSEAEVKEIYNNLKNKKINQMKERVV